jgi:hypothetical protein
MSYDKRYSESNKMSILPKKFLCIVLALIFILGLVGITAPSICAGHDEGRCMGHEMPIPQHSAEPKKVSLAECCCCEDEAAPCNAFEDCTSSLLDLGFFVVPPMNNLTSADLTPATADPLHDFDSLGGLTSKVSSSSMAPAVQLFLLNLSLLC